MTTQSPRTSNPLDRLRAITGAEASRREAQREANRAIDPDFAALADSLRAMGADVRVMHWQSHDGTRAMGKLPTVPAGSFEVSAETFRALEEQRKWTRRRK